jgi:hypothetical protein
MRPAIVLLFLVAGAVADDARDKWAREVRELWDAARRVPLDDAVDAGAQVGERVLPGEHGRYRIEFPGGRVRCTDQAPHGDAGVRAVWQRTPAPPSVQKVGGSGDGPVEFWVRVAWIKEKGRWEPGSAREARASADDRHYRAWMMRAGYGRHMRGTGLQTWALAHGYLTKDRTALRTARDALARKDDAETKARVEKAEAAYRKRLDEVERGLRQAGRNLGVGDAFWRCEKATLALAEAVSDEKTAKAEVAKWRHLDRTEEREKAEAAWKKAGARANACRRDRREAMKAVMRGVF